MSDHLIAEANRHAMALPKTNPTHADIAWYVREVYELRAEAERLKRDYDYDHKCLHEVRERCELWKQRAERAEAELKKWSLLNLWGGTPEIIHAFIKGQQNRICAAEKAEAELAAERARLDWLLSRMGGNVLPVNGCVAWTVDVYHYKNQFPSRAAIDAAMKEGA